jgi:Predicted S-adenosylmethionine-dependent methyltransferase involved in bacterial cell division
MTLHSGFKNPHSAVLPEKSPADPFFWREQWWQLKLAHCAVPDYGNAKEFWADKKRIHTVYLKDHNKRKKSDTARLDAMKIPLGSRVLDIGAGPGIYAVPLAIQGCRVTVVEPSPVMRKALEENMRESKVAGITIIPKRWEDVTARELDGPFDVVIASYSLTMMDMGEALLKMQACCTGTIHLFWFMTSPAWVQVNRDLWPLLHGGEFPGEPTADWLWQILCEMGIYANVEIETRFAAPVYATVDDAVKEFSRRLNCTTAAQEETVRNYFQSVLRQEERGLVLGEKTLGAHIWWSTDPGNEDPEKMYTVKRTSLKKSVGIFGRTNRAD